MSFDSTRRPDRELHAIVLAGGEGRRLAPLTRVLYGTPLPKQFAVLQGERSLLQSTVARVVRRFAPSRVLVVVCESWRELARRQLADWPEVELVAQPANRDTAPGLLLPILRLLARDPRARFVAFPSDHFLEDEEPFLDAVEAAALGCHLAPAGLCLVAVEPDAPETEYGWIVPGAPPPAGPTSRLRLVSRFVEKPDAAAAGRLFDAGGWWNTFVLAGRADRCLALADLHVPRCTSLLRRHAVDVGTRREAASLRELYARLDAANFSRDVLAHARGLAAVSAPRCGWSDWGTPARVIQSLGERPDGLRLRKLYAELERLAESSRREFVVSSRATGS